MPRPSRRRPRSWCATSRRSSRPARSGPSPLWPSRACWPRPGPGPTWSGRWSSKARADGLGATRQAVGGRLAEDLPLGYSAAGVVSRSGRRSPASGRASWSPPAARARPATPSTRRCRGCSARPCPHGVPAGRRGLHHHRVDRPARPAAGRGRSRIARWSSSGSGLIGQLAARLAIAAGCEVAGIDPLPTRASPGGRRRGTGPGRVRRRHDRADPGLVPGPRRGRRAGLRGRHVLGRR